ncbi:glycosyltransferase involved in cell wall biosynthesis [Desulfobotulus alkaliphilus]|uniref:Glycosyltransferase involved in cell wall biosynthesis n=1 Tax=Desulfobotulus alkaliphilus TaxID=622671 RepID=A0A562R471_9BACT|nr:hypothetical protein [Desulfobotulus alkaliphilus]TWI63384.1 glycosyltransferase involved in cell wall biosynthesis [Desulfobotulus alkaliphilus]
MNILIIQPLVPHYRQSFFDRLCNRSDLLILFGRNDKSFKLSTQDHMKKVKSFFVAGAEFFCIYDDLKKRRPDVVITYGEVKQLSNILLFILKPFFKYKLVFWSHGFKYKKMNLIDKLRLFQLKRADGVLFYTEACRRDAEERFGVKNAFHLNNTLDFGVVLPVPEEEKEINKKKYNIRTKINGIFISRFTPLKAPELLLKLMLEIHKKNSDIGFIIVGDGPCKPDFSSYDFIYDFGRVYDEAFKAILFGMVDFSFMPNGIGLSIVEGFIHGLPMATLKNGVSGVAHGVEVLYLEKNVTGVIADSESDLVDYLSDVSTEELQRMGNNARMFALNNLSMDNMVNNFCHAVEKIKRL